MCTAASLGRYFGRNFDYNISYNEEVLITPRNFKITFRNTEDIPKHNAMIGISAGGMDYPLYYDAYNEKGLGIAGLNFPEYCKYLSKKDESKVNLAEFELIPYILSKADNVGEAKKLMNNIVITDESYSENLPVTPLHWMVADQNSSFVVESTGEGLKVIDNPVGILTNSPQFEKQLFNLNNYLKLSNEQPENSFLDIDLVKYSRGMGGMGLPGDFSSMSRFVKAVFVRHFSKDFESIPQFFHILSSVAQPKGSTKVDDEGYEYTIYSSCMDLKEKLFYYKTYDDIAIHSVDLKEHLDECKMDYIKFI